MDAKETRQAKTDKPHGHFDNPQQILADPALSKQDKLKALETLEQDARLLATATEEGMTGGEHSNLISRRAGLVGAAGELDLWGYFIARNDPWRRTSRTEANIHSEYKTYRGWQPGQDGGTPAEVSDQYVASALIPVPPDYASNWSYHVEVSAGAQSMNLAAPAPTG